MASLAAALGADAAPVEIHWSRGVAKLQTMELGKVLSALEQWLIQREAENLIKGFGLAVKHGLMTRPEVIEEIKKFNDDAVNNGRFAFGGERMSNLLAKAEGFAKDMALDSGLVKMFALMMNVDEFEVIPLFLEKGDEVLLKLGLTMAKSLPDPNDPNSKGAATPKTLPRTETNGQLQSWLDESSAGPAPSPG